MTATFCGGWRSFLFAVDHYDQRRNCDEQRKKGKKPRIRHHAHHPHSGGEKPPCRNKPAPEKNRLSAYANFWVFANLLSATSMIPYFEPIFNDKAPFPTMRKRRSCIDILAETAYTIGADRRTRKAVLPALGHK